MNRTSPAPATGRPQRPRRTAPTVQYQLICHNLPLSPRQAGRVIEALTQTGRNGGLESLRATEIVAFKAAGGNDADLQVPGECRGKLLNLLEGQERAVYISFLLRFAAAHMVAEQYSDARDTYGAILIPCRDNVPAKIGQKAAIIAKSLLPAAKPILALFSAYTETLASPEGLDWKEAAFNAAISAIVESSANPQIDGETLFIKLAPLFNFPESAPAEVNSAADFYCKAVSLTLRGLLDASVPATAIVHAFGRPIIEELEMALASDGNEHVLFPLRLSLMIAVLLHEKSLPFDKIEEAIRPFGEPVVQAALESEIFFLAGAKIRTGIEMAPPRIEVVPLPLDAAEAAVGLVLDLAAGTRDIKENPRTTAQEFYALYLQAEEVHKEEIGATLAETAVTCANEQPEKIKELILFLNTLLDKHDEKLTPHLNRGTIAMLLSPSIKRKLVASASELWQKVKIAGEKAGQELLALPPSIPKSASKGIRTQKSTAPQIPIAEEYLALEGISADDILFIDFFFTRFATFPIVQAMFGEIEATIFCDPYSTTDRFYATILHTSKGSEKALRQFATLLKKTDGLPYTRIEATLKLADNKLVDLAFQVAPPLAPIITQTNITLFRIQSFYAWAHILSKRIEAYIQKPHDYKATAHSLICTFSFCAAKVPMLADNIPKNHPFSYYAGHVKDFVLTQTLPRYGELIRGGNSAVKAAVAAAKETLSAGKGFTLYKE
ncbi:MAG: hypothetical protein WCV91_00160 [Candidatus Margulisiibacteriota bacterium]